MTKCLGLFFVILILLSSCSSHYYVPSDAMLLGLDEKGDVKVSAGYGTNAGRGHHNRNYSILAGYSPLKHLGMTANFFHFNNQNDESFGRGQTGEITIGTYINEIETKPAFKYSENTELGKDKIYDVVMGESKRVTTLDIYAGYGYGSVSNYYTDGGFFKLSFKRYFIQSAVHVKYNKVLSFSTGIKFLRINYQKGLLQGSISAHDLMLIKQIRDINPISIWEWMGRMEVGWLHFRCHGGFTILSQWDKKEVFSFVPLVVSIGTTIDL